jgi:hypothetical protein
VYILPADTVEDSSVWVLGSPPFLASWAHWMGCWIRSRVDWLVGPGAVVVVVLSVGCRLLLGVVVSIFLAPGIFCSGCRLSDVPSVRFV